MTDLREADFSGRPETDLTLEERAELKRRFSEFVTAMKEQDLRCRAKQEPAKPKKKVVKWQPPAAGKGRRRS